LQIYFQISTRFFFCKLRFQKEEEEKEKETVFEIIPNLCVCKRNDFIIGPMKDQNWTTHSFNFFDTLKLEKKKLKLTPKKKRVSIKQKREYSPYLL
jgi:hypothetical protein